MTVAATLTSKGQVTLPKPIRDSLGLKKGDQVVFEATSRGAFLLKPITRRSRLEGLLHKHLPKNFRPPSRDEIDQAIAEGAIRGRFGK